MAKVIGCDIHWRNDVVSAALPVPPDGQFESYCAVILCTILLRLTLAANVSSYVKICNHTRQSDKTRSNLQSTSN
jgi:hypothetical protein